MSQIFLALVVAFGAVNFTACGADESKAPQIRSETNGWGATSIYAISQDDDTIIEGVTVSGRDGECPKHTVVDFLERTYTDVETCKEVGNNGDGACDIFGEHELRYGKFKTTYAGNGKEGFLGSEKFCPPKNGVWKIELETNFGTYEYELQDK